MMMRTTMMMMMGVILHNQPKLMNLGPFSSMSHTQQPSEVFENSHRKMSKYGVNSTSSSLPMKLNFKPYLLKQVPQRHTNLSLQQNPNRALFPIVHQVRRHRIMMKSLATAKKHKSELAVNQETMSPNVKHLPKLMTRHQVARKKRVRARILRMSKRPVVITPQLKNKIIKKSRKEHLTGISTSLPDTSDFVYVAPRVSGKKVIKD